MDRAQTPLVLGVVSLLAIATFLVGAPTAAQESPAAATPTPAAAATPAPAATVAPASPAAASPATGATPAPAGSPAPTERPPRAGPSWERAAPADGGRGFQLHDVIAGGPGFIAVGGGQARRDDASPRALIWLSDDGQRWQSAPLFGDAATGVIQAITATPEGFLAVGGAGDSAAVWTSADGIVWGRVPDAEAFAGATMNDVVSGDTGFTAVGCQAPDCAAGRVWRSADGTTWEVVADMTMIPFSIAETADGFVASGTDSDIGGRGATATSPDGVTWTVTVAERRPGALNDAASFADSVLVAGNETVGEGRRRRANGVLLTWDGATWVEVPSSRFRGSSFQAVGTSEGRIVLVGSRLEDEVTIPFSLWSSDLDRFLRGRFPRAVENDGARVNGAAFSADGAIAVAVGVLDDGRPAAWFSDPAESAQPS